MKYTYRVNDVAVKIRGQEFSTDVLDAPDAQKNEKQPEYMWEYPNVLDAALEDVALM